MQVLIIADDLTGALDSVVAFANRGLRSVVLRHPAAMRGFDFSSVDVVAVSTGSRDGSVEAARAAVAQVVSALGGMRPAHVFKKVDSRLKGHVGAETAVLADGLGLTRLLVARPFRIWGGWCAVVLWSVWGFMSRSRLRPALPDMVGRLMGPGPRMGLTLWHLMWRAMRISMGFWSVKPGRHGRPGRPGGLRRRA